MMDSLAQLKQQSGAQFGTVLVKKARCRSIDSIIRPKSLNYICSIIVKRLSTYGTLQDPSHWTKITVVCAIFGRFVCSLVAQLGTILAWMSKTQQCFYLPKLYNSLLLLYNEIRYLIIYLKPSCAVHVLILTHDCNL